MKPSGEPLKILPMDDDQVQTITGADDISAFAMGLRDEIGEYLADSGNLFPISLDADVTAALRQRPPAEN